MAELVRQGYLIKAHSSSGRAPTTLGWRYYIQELIDLVELEAREEIEIREQLFQDRFNRPILIRNAVINLSQLSGLPSVAVLKDALYFYGMSDLIDHPEFENNRELQRILLLFENPTLLEKIFASHKGAGIIKTLIGEEMNYADFANCAIVFSDFRSYKNERGSIAVIGPKRMDYARVIPSVEFIANSLSRVISGW
jgi:heat-inducible transcriptional repressor